MLSLLRPSSSRYSLRLSRASHIVRLSVPPNFCRKTLAIPFCILRSLATQLSKAKLKELPKLPLKSRILLLEQIIVGTPADENEKDLKLKFLVQLLSLSSQLEVKAKHILPHTPADENEKDLKLKFLVQLLSLSSQLEVKAKHNARASSTLDAAQSSVELEKSDEDDSANDDLSMPVSKLQNPSGRLARWSVHLQQYDFEIIHRKGKEHLVLDGLSRSVPIVNIVSHYSETPSIDRWYIKLLESVQSQPVKYPKYRVDVNVLYKTTNNTNVYGFSDQHEIWKMVVPKERRAKLLHQSHDIPTSGHLGVYKTFNQLATKYYWPKIKHDVTTYIRKCQTLGSY
ncbi:Integrase zinc binding domain [Popillia japonica]|uniref:RNA-directed DNA polymerase n=2 Tax=Popillia japonica TaxID=7064 RepID=A0AAW1M0I3_POPJA